MKMMMNKFVVVSLGVLIAGAGWSKELTLYDGTGGGYVEKDVKFHHQAKLSGAGPFRCGNAYTLTTPLSPYSAYAGPRFYGGYEFSSSKVDAGLSREMVRNDISSADPIYLQAWNKTGWGGSDLSLHGVLLFKLSEIDPGYVPGAVPLDGLSIKINGYGNDSGVEAYDAFGRFVLRIGGDFYVSQVEFDVAKKTSFELPGSILSEEKWAKYNPEQELDFDQKKASFQSLDLNGVSAVGFYFEDDLWSGTDSATTAFGLGLVELKVSFAEAVE